MRYSIVAAALAAAVYATPLVMRDVVVDYVWVTQVVTVTDVEPAPKATDATVMATHGWWGHYFQHWHGDTPDQAKTTTTEAKPALKSTKSDVDTPAPAPTTHHKPKPVSTSTKSDVDTPAPAPKPTSTTTSSTSTTSTTSSTSTTSTTAEAPTTTAEAVSSVAESTSAPSYKPLSFKEKVMIHHNVHRHNHSVDDLEWDDGLAATAWKIANTCWYKHNVQMDGGGYGQNIAGGAPPDAITWIITGGFYNGEINSFAPYYGDATPHDMTDAIFESFGHYTQIVWKDTKKVGCAVVNCTGRGLGNQGLGNVGSNVPPYFTVCNYSPPGNYIGEFGTNVLRPLGHATVNGDYGFTY